MLSESLLENMLPQIPNEVILKIFKYLDFLDLKSTRTTCKLLKHISDHVSTLSSKCWKSYNICHSTTILSFFEKSSSNHFLSALGFARALLNLTIIPPLGLPPTSSAYNSCISRNLNESQWVSMGFNESQWDSMSLNEPQYASMSFSTIQVFGNRERT